MKKFYIYDANGKYLSEDGQQRFTLLSGKALFNFLKTPEGKQKHFEIAIDDNGDEIGVEVPPLMVEEFIVEENHKNYTNRTKEQSGYTIISLSAGKDEEGNTFSEENVADEDADVQKEVLKKLELDTLRYALTQLNETERQLIFALFLSPKTLTLGEYAEILGVCVSTVYDRKKAALKKLKTFF